MNRYFHLILTLLVALATEASATTEASERYQIVSQQLAADFDPLAAAAGSITVNGHALVYVKSLDLYLCTQPSDCFDHDFTAIIAYEPLEGGGTLQVDDDTVYTGTNHAFGTISGGKKFFFSIAGSNGQTVKKAVTFTSLPVVQLNGTFNNSYREGTIAVHEPDKDVPQLFQMKAKWRGGITNGSGKNKRNYHVKLLQADGSKMEQKFFGLRKDNSWILESCQVDMSRIRNRVLTDLWNSFCVSPYYGEQEPKALSGTRGQFVELILNGDYRGIYCMTENMDRKQLKLRKYDEADGTVHGQLWKSKDWSYGVFMGHDSNSNYYPKRHPSNYSGWSTSWENYNVKYPDTDDIFPTDWKVLYDAVDFVCTSTEASFKEHIGEYFDLPVVIDYYILMETVLSTDNHGKNMFFAVYDKQQDKRITLGVWDMDATCGQRWSDDYYHQSFLGPEQDYSQFIIRYEHGDYNLFRRLRSSDADNFNMQVRLRYRDLRNGPLATDSILSRFSNYISAFKTCGAAQRESNRWSYNSDVAGHKLDFDTELNYISDWFTRRMNYLDQKRFRIAELPNDIATLPADEPAATDKVFNLRGQQVGTLANIAQLPRGIYVVNGKKIVKP